VKARNASLELVVGSRVRQTRPSWRGIRGVLGHTMELRWLRQRQDRERPAGRKKSASSARAVVRARGRPSGRSPTDHRTRRAARWGREFAQPRPGQPSRRRGVSRWTENHRPAWDRKSVAQTAKSVTGWDDRHALSAPPARLAGPERNSRSCGERVGARCRAAKLRNTGRHRASTRLSV